MCPISSFHHSSMFRCTNRHALHRRLLFFIFISISFLLITITRQQEISSSPSIIDQTIILVRTSHYCQSRLDYLRQSWIPPNSVDQSNIYFLTDNLAKYSNGARFDSLPKFIETNCPETHNQMDLCCKTASEFEFFYNQSQSNSKLHWMCRFDDDE